MLTARNKLEINPINFLAALRVCDLSLVTGKALGDLLVYQVRARNSTKKLPSANSAE